MAYVVFALYFIYTLGQVLNFKWTVIDPTSSSLDIITTWQAGFFHIAGFLNACLVFILVSSSSTCLYMASRIIYGLANDIPDSSVAGRILHKFALVIPQTGIPCSALLFSFIMIAYAPIIQRIKGYGNQDVGCLQGLITDLPTDTRFSKSLRARQMSAV